MEYSFSNHSTLSFILKSSGPAGNPCKNLRKTNWEKFKSKMDSKWSYNLV